MVQRPADSTSKAADSKPRRLGRGLSSLLNVPEPVRVETQSVTANKKPSAGPSSGVATPGEAVVAGGRPQSPREVGVPSAGAPGGSDSAVEQFSDLRSIGVGEIRVGRFQPRREMDESAIAGLAESIKRSGLMQPVIVRPVRGGGYELVAGERRWRAARSAGLGVIPALVRSLTDEEAAEWGLVENIQREDLNPMDRAAALRSLSEQFAVSAAEIASRLGLDRTTVVNLMRLTELEPEIAGLISSGRLGAGHGKALLGVPGGEGRVALARQASQFSWSVRRIEEEARRAGAAGKKPAMSVVGVEEPTAREAVVRDMEKQITEALGTRVTIRTDKRGRRGQIVISFYGLDQFDGLLQRLGARGHGAGEM